MTCRAWQIAVLLVLIAVSPAGAEPASWTSWRGPSAHGSVAEGEYPETFDAETYQWKVELPGRGCSTPILVNQQIVLTAPVEGRDAVLCYGLDGKERWRAVFGEENAGKHRNGSGCNASPVTDGEAVYVYFKSGTFAAVELDGKVRWKTDLVERFGKDTLFWDHGTSPVLTERFAVMARMHHGESWVAAFDKKSGEIAWKVDRNYSTPVEGDHGYTTPLVVRHQGKEAILVWGAEHVTIHDSADGSVLWSCGDFNPEGQKLWPAIATPLVLDGMAVIAYGRNDRGIPRLHGVRLEGEGDVTASNHAWKRNDVGTFVPTPTVHQGRVIVVGDQGKVTCLAPRTGETVWQAAFPKSRAKFYASPLVAGDKLYAPREDGVVMVARLGDDRLELVAENDMGESIIGSPVPAGKGLLLLRGEHHLFGVASP